MCDGFEEEQLASALDKFKEVVCEKTGETSYRELTGSPIGSRREFNLTLIPF